MQLDKLSEFDKSVIGEALRAAVDGPFFPDWEFKSLFDLERSEVQAISEVWPNINSDSRDVELAVNNALVNLLGYPHNQESVWREWISVGPAQLQELFDRLRGLRAKT